MTKREQRLLLRKYRPNVPEGFEPIEGERSLHRPELVALRYRHPDSRWHILCIDTVTGAVERSQSTEALQGKKTHASDMRQAFMYALCEGERHLFVPEDLIDNEPLPDPSPEDIAFFKASVRYIEERKRRQLRLDEERLARLYPPVEVPRTP